MTGDNNFQHASSHNRRCRYARRLLVDGSTTLCVVTQVGGWSSFRAVEPYLNASTGRADNEFARTDVV